MARNKLPTTASNGYIETIATVMRRMTGLTYFWARVVVLHMAKKQTESLISVERNEETSRATYVFTLCFSMFCACIASCSRVDPKKNAGAVDGQETVAHNDTKSLDKEVSEANAIAVQDGHAYVGVGRRLVVVDVSDPRKPVLVGRTPFLSDGAHHHVRDVAVLGKYVYLAVCRVPGIVRSGFLVIDVSDPTAPHEVASVTEGSALGVSVVGSHAYVYTGDRLEVVDVDDPSAPRTVGHCEQLRCCSSSVSPLFCERPAWTFIVF